MPHPDEPRMMGCDLCNDQGPLFLHARCHLTAPLQAILDGDELILRCYVPECRSEVARFKVVRPAAALAPPANPRGNS